MLEEEPKSQDPRPPVTFDDAAGAALFGEAIEERPATAAPRLWVPLSVAEAAPLFPEFEIRRLIGHGGMGAVYEARQLSLDRLVALKVLPRELGADPVFSERFTREARLLARLNHRGIVSIYDSGRTAGGLFFFIMEWVEGTNLADLIHGPGIKEAEALAIIARVCAALHHAHSVGVIHCDMKPANVLVSRSGEVKVADFGVARFREQGIAGRGAAASGVVLGTPDYMAPEQSGGRPVDQRADIFSLGVMLYEMLCGELPRGAFDPPSTRARADVRLDEIVHRAMRPAPDLRYSTTEEMRSALEKIRLGPPPRGWGWQRGLAVGAAVAVVYAVVAWSYAHRPQGTVGRVASARPAEITPPAIPRAAEPASVAPVPLLGPTPVPPKIFEPWEGWQTLAMHPAEFAELQKTPPGSDGWRRLTEATSSFGPELKNGAVRARFRYRPEKLARLIAHYDREKGFFCAEILPGGKQAAIFVSRQADPAGPAARITTCDLMHPLIRDSDYTMELRTEGDHLSLYIDGERCAVLHSAFPPTGRVGFSGGPLVFRDFEWGTFPVLAAMSPQPTPVLVSGAFSRRDRLFIPPLRRAKEVVPLADLTRDTAGGHWSLDAGGARAEKTARAEPLFFSPPVTLSGSYSLFADFLLPAHTPPENVFLLLPLPGGRAVPLSLSRRSFWVGLHAEKSVARLESRIPFRLEGIKEQPMKASISVRVAKETAEIVAALPGFSIVATSGTFEELSLSPEEMPHDEKVRAWIEHGRPVFLSYHPLTWQSVRVEAGPAGASP